ncbi:hypothetical protein C9374_012497 [Naegleria lovaniensis]|uniref:BTB domain-containing protein n=1 Tax=Naegleria lovaniensis TaxID=51637 RepID=A0AA88KW03_NAELO|nr:uncharacterized protein C9374_012497 [Naegleria lovaniensis]KAG2392245.1 hypothetical protein C9374_012497 [Naegleria lovaniensis]
MIHNDESSCPIDEISSVSTSEKKRKEPPRASNGVENSEANNNDDSDDVIMRKKMKFENEVVLNEEPLPQPVSIEEVLKQWHVKKAKHVFLDLLKENSQNGVSSAVSHTELLNDLIEQREEIESVSLYLLEQMVIKCQVHSVQFIRDLLEKNRNEVTKKADDKYQVELLLGDTHRPSHMSDGDVLSHWLKFVLPKVVSKQNELNLVETVHENSEQIDTKNEEQQDLYEEFDRASGTDVLAFNVDEAYFMQEGETLQLDDEELDDNEVESTQIEVVSELSYTPKGNFPIRFNNESNKFVFTENVIDDDKYQDSCIRCTYLFDEMLPDETDAKYIESPLPDLKNAENPFACLLEKVMIMFERNTTPQDHQTFEVSRFRLATSLLLLKCINTELVYLRNRTTSSTFGIMCRPLIRMIIDVFIDDRKCIYFQMDDEQQALILGTDEDVKQDIKIQCADIDHGSEEMTFSEEEDESEDDDDEKVNQVTPPTKSEYIEDDIEEQDSTCSSDYDSEEITDFKKFDHPMWYNNMTQTKFIEICSFNKNINHPVPISLESTHEFLSSEYLEDEEIIKEPLVEQERVTFYVENEYEAEDMIHSVDHVFEPSLLPCHQAPESNSLVPDILRLMRRAGVRSEHEGAVMEGFFSLKEFISKHIEYFIATKTDDTVTMEDVFHASKDVFKTVYTPKYVNGYSRNDRPKYEECVIPLEYCTKPVHPPKEYDLVEFEDALLKGCFGVEEPVDDPTPIAVYETHANNGKMADYIAFFLDEIKENSTANSNFCDSFILSTDRRKLGIYTPIVKSRCPSLYNEYFDSPEKRKQGLKAADLSEAYPDIRLPLEFDLIFEWMEYVYRGYLPDSETRDEHYRYDDYLKDSKHLRTIDILVDHFPLEIEEDDDWFSSQLDNDKECKLDRFDPKNTCYTLHTLYQDEDTKDFKLYIIKDERKVEFSLHKYVLASRSQFFRTLFENQVDEYDASEIFADEKSLKNFTFYIYHNFLEKPSCPFEVEQECEEDNISDMNDEDSETSGHEEENTNKVEEVSDMPISTTNTSLSTSSDEAPSDLETLYSLDDLFNLYEAADYLGEENLCQLCEYLIGQQTTMENALEVLEFALNNYSVEAFSAAELFILSCGNPSFISEHFSGEELNYFHTLQGPISFENVIPKLGYVMKIVESNSSQLNDVYKIRMSQFHKPKLLWFIVRNISQFSTESLQKLQNMQYSYIVEESELESDQTSQKTATANLLSLVQFLADRYGYCSQF